MKFDYRRSGYAFQRAGLETFLPDAAVVAAACFAALVFLFSACRRAGPLWLLRHAVVTQGNDKRKVWPGEWGKTVIVTFAAISALVVIFFTGDVTLIETAGNHPGAITGGFAIPAWGFQTALEESSENKAAVKVRMPLKKFRPDDGRSPRRRPPA